ncbi:MAG TPA: hypothetical protein VFG68_16230 [Fimbriiglobus sp.]|nr:hypothetical protein [Fimbriiglobus sp.]
MGKIKLDAATAETLKAAEPGTELVGPDGQPVGALVPPAVYRYLQQFLEERKQLLEAEKDAISVEELRAIDAAGGEIPHDEVVRRLGLS